MSLDQLRALVTVVEQGSFSAAARKLRRVQSAISTAMGNLEQQLGVPIWDRSKKAVKLTAQGQAVVAASRRILTEVDALRRLTSELSTGLEASVSLCVDALFPVSALVDLCGAFVQKFPTVDLRVDTQLMSAVSARVVDGAATIGVVSPLGLVPGLERRVLAAIRMVSVVGPRHVLAGRQHPISTAHLADCVQVVLSERTESGVADQAVLSPRTWRVADLHTKHALLRANLGWGNLPEHLARPDIEAGKLVAIQPLGFGADEHRLHLWAVYRHEASFGPAHRWVLEELQRLCSRDAESGAPERAPSVPRPEGRASRRSRAAPGRSTRRSPR